MGVMSLGRHIRPTCIQGFMRSLKLCQACRFNSCVRVFFIPRGSREFYDHIWAMWRHISHMGEILDSDWSRQNLLRSDWLLPTVAIHTTVHSKCLLVFACLGDSVVFHFWLLPRFFYTFLKCLLSDSFILVWHTKKDNDLSTKDS